MNWNIFVVCTLVITGLLLVPSVQGVNLLTIDTFVTGGSASSIIYSISAYGVDGTWYSPYNPTTPPQAKFFSTTDALGGQRDLILGYIDPVPVGSTAIVNVVSRRASISFPLNWIGGAYFQWDGFDDAGSGTAFPGATLNPGLTAPVDITFNGQANGLALSITSDQDTDYRVTLVNSAGGRNQYRFILRANEPAFTFVPLLYSSSIWNSAGFNFADVRGFEVQIQTGTDTSSNAPDTQFTPLFIFSYAISGNAFIRCNCGTTTIDQRINAAQIDLYTAANVFIKSTTTDVNGDYTFWALNPTTYNICYHDTNAQLCTSSTPRCQAVTIDPLLPAATYTVNFAVTQTTTFSIPGDVNGDCQDCQIPDGTSNCPGYAQTTGCLGGVTVVTAFTDVTTGNSCRTNIVRTWTSPDDGSKKTQRLTFTDTTPPTFATPPQDLTQDCDNIITSLSDWVAADGFADDFDDCSNYFVNDNWNGLPVGPCNSVTVTFTLQDECGNVRLPASTATYTLRDTSGPSIDSPALDLTVECAAKTTNVINSLNAWLGRHADAVASDNCVSASSITWTNNYAQQVPLSTNSCFDSVDVTFTARDTCGNTNSDVATFTVQDTTPAIFTTAPQNFNQQCAGSVADTNAFNTWLNNHANARFTDACSTNDLDITITDDFTPRTINECSDSIVVNFTLQDFCGNPSVTAPATFTIVDSLPPVFSQFAGDQTVECDGAGNQDDYDAWIADNGGARATDACTAVTWVADRLTAPATPACRSSVLTTFTASDACGLSVTTQATFTIVDTTAPFFVNAPADDGAECNNGAAQAYLDWLNIEAGATATDLCNPATVIITDNDPALVLGCNRANIVQFRAVDECLNSSPIATAAFTVVDTTAPVITNTGSPLNIECNAATSASDYNTWLISHAGGDAVDDCTTVTWSNDGGAPITLGCLFTRDVTFTASDQCGFSDFFIQTATITDSTPPTLQSEASDEDIQCTTVTIPTSNDQYATWIANHGFAVATDACTAITWTDDHVGLVGVDTCFASETVTFTASDACAGHFVQTTATFTVRDTRPPNVIQGAQVTTVECDPNLNGNAFLAWIQNHGNAIVQDDCSPLTWTVSLFQTPVGCSSVTVEFTADDGCGSSIVTTGTFNIVDTLPPTFTTQAQNPRIECDGAGNVADYANYLATHGGATASDVCTTSATWTNNAIGTGPVGCGSETIAFTVTDSCGQRSTTTGTFTIIDSFAPSIFPPAADQSAECDNNSNPIAIATWLLARGGASATDSCYSTGSLTWTNDFTTLTRLPCGAAATVTFSVSDPCSNVARTTATFRVNDTLPPVITKQAQDLVLECNAATNNQDTLTWVNSRATASATDSCTSVTWTNNFVATPDPCSGPYVVNYYATDQCGNRATTTASVTIVDSVAPTFVDFPEDVQVVCDEITDSSVTGIPGFNDNCLSADVIRSESDQITVQPFERLCPGDTIITRTWKLTDACGNVAARDQLIVVSIPQGPCIPQPCIPCEEQPLLCCASSIAPVPCNPVECTPVDCAHTQCTTVPCLPVVCGNGAPPPFQDDDDTIAPSPRPQASECEPIYIYVFDDDDGVSTQPVYTVSFTSSASSVSCSLFSLILAFLLIFM